MVKSRLKILLLSTSSQVGGGPQVVYDLAKLLQQQQIEVEVAMPAGGTYVNRLQQLNLTVHQVPLDRLNLGTLRAVIKLIRQHEYSVLHSHGKGAGLYARLAGVICGIPVIHTHHGIFIERYAWPIKMIYICFERLLSCVTATTINVSHGQQQLGIKLHMFVASKATVIYNGCSTEDFYPANIQQKLDRRRELGLNPHHLVMLYVARMHPQKNHQLLLRQYTDFRQQSDHQDTLVLVGGGDLLAASQELANSLGLADSVIFAGEQTNVLPYYQAADLYLSSAIVEGLPVTLIEAQLTGLPAIVSNVIGNNEVVIPGKTGLLFSLKQPHQMVQCLLEVSNPAKRKSMVKASVEQAVARFSLQTFVDQHVTLYKRVARL